ncbi:TrkH family potassium uptake protein [Pelagibacterium xiamenense]|uniref:TrkH family potassium uptake protein n=1 Tax=Pelagibacterium xiamenense TaxID=2901140 RepID=UPI001E5F808B|nr:TrkH family potassium uptake protein [Pelagibacterium xiamenense]MCD7060436.1 TrkH family potassium uptake protein [Pelagibacterium xiamenense]
MILATAYICGLFNLILAAAMLIPMVADLFAENLDWQSFLGSALIVGLPSLLLVISTRRTMPPFSLRFGFLLVNAVWFSTSIVAAVPFVLSGQGLSFADAVFEATSGITTTGSTVLSGLDSLPPGILLWRSLTQWLGGLGIIAMGLLLLPFLRVGGMQVYKMESSIQSDSPYSRFTQFSAALLWLYLVLSVCCAVAYWATGMSVFDAINHAMSTISTGGYSTHDASMGHFGPATLAVGIVFMIAGALPFVAILRALVTGKLRDAWEIQIPVLLSILGIFTLVITLAGLFETDRESYDILIHAAFNITSVVTTTGFASTDYTLWGPFVIALFLVGTFLGGAAGSTSGGFKTYRLIILYQSLRVGLKELIYPNGVFIMRYGRTDVPGHAARSVGLFMAAFVLILLAGTLGLAATGLDLVTAFTGALTALTNVGPGLGELIGPAGNFSSLSDPAKWILSAAMLLGRLEILTVMVLFTPAFWRT